MSLETPVDQPESPTNRPNSTHRLKEWFSRDYVRKITVIFIVFTIITVPIAWLVIHFLELSGGPASSIMEELETTIFVFTLVSAPLMAITAAVLASTVPSAALRAAFLVSSAALPVASKLEMAYAGRIMANRKPIQAGRSAVVPPVSNSTEAGAVSCLTTTRAMMTITMMAASAITPTLLSRAAAYTPAMFTSVTRMMIPMAHRVI